MSDFAREVSAWQRAHGRHDLPWQGTRDAYAIWVSEIMLQQTQVSTVIPFYTRFMARFPDIAALARAPLDDVLAHWSGLGYYSRARNLHAAAIAICERHGGVFPSTMDEVVALPGIGRSTAAAILVFAYGTRAAILDGNVKRVLARCYAIRGPTSDAKVQQAMWRQAEALLPDTDIECYTQGLMDLGASLCVRRAPRCAVCPLHARCKALAQDCVDELPTPRARRAVPRRATVMLILEHEGRVLLEKRPAPGIWGGLWSLPEIAPGGDATNAAASLGYLALARQRMDDIEHAFTHFTLTITPQRMRVEQPAPAVAAPGRQWWTLEEARAAALPAPVRRILSLMADNADVLP